MWSPIEIITKQAWYGADYSGIQYTTYTILFCRDLKILALFILFIYLFLYT